MSEQIVLTDTRTDRDGNTIYWQAMGDRGTVTMHARPGANLNRLDTDHALSLIDQAERHKALDLWRRHHRWGVVITGRGWNMRPQLTLKRGLFVLSTFTRCLVITWPAPHPNPTYMHIRVGHIRE